MATIRTNTNEFKRRIDEYLTKALDNDDNTDQSTAGVAAFSKKQFHSEKGYQIPRIGMQESVKDWLQGAATRIEIWDEDIIALAKSLGTLEDDASETKERRIIDNYFPFMAYHVIKFWERHAS